MFAPFSFAGDRRVIVCLRKTKRENDAREAPEAKENKTTGGECVMTRFDESEPCVAMCKERLRAQRSAASAFLFLHFLKLFAANEHSVHFQHFLPHQLCLGSSSEKIQWNEETLSSRCPFPSTVLNRWGRH